MSMPDDQLDSPNWSKPLGKGLPPFGPPQFKIWPYALGGVLGLALIAGAGCLAYPYVLPPKVLGHVVSHHETLRDAALAWRNAHSKDPATAEGAQVWRRAEYDDPCCLPTLPSDTDPGDFLVVRPAAEGSEDDAGGLFKSDQTRVITAPAERWDLALKSLSPQVQSTKLGSQALGRGTVLVELKPVAPGPTMLVASASSPETGDAHQADLSLAPFAGCLPLLNEEYVEGVVARPFGQPGTSPYWLAWTNTNVALLATGPCQATGAPPLSSKTYPLAPGKYPLLSLLNDKEPQPYVLLMPAEQDGAAPQLLESSSLNPQQLVNLGVVTSRGIPKSGDKGEALAADKVFDSFQQGLPGATPGESPVPVRVLDKGTVSYLIPNDDGWGFANCSSPKADNYLVVNDSCGELDGGKYVAMSKSQATNLSHCREVGEPRPGAFDGSLGPSQQGLRKRTECLYMGWTQVEDEECNIRVAHAPCVGGGS